jgi:8-oxo-dGTP pyrophosphatase MutT (NUDIX family)
MGMLSHDSETPAHGRQVVTVCAFIHQKFGDTTRLFMPKRADTKKFRPGVYELPGGHINFGESPADGLERELQEELSIEVTISEPFYVFSYINPIKGSHSIEIIYFAQFDDDFEDIVLNPEDHSGYIWIAENELHKATTHDKTLEDDEMVGIKKGFEILRKQLPDQNKHSSAQDH